jgi:dipeptidase E
MKGRPWFEQAEDDIKLILKGIKEIIVVPYALHNMDKYKLQLSEAFARFGVSVISTHDYSSRERKIINNADAIYLAGGNTTRLLANLHALKNSNGSLVDKRTKSCKKSLIQAIRRRASVGTPILGASAGLNVMMTDIRTTNDMHIAMQRNNGKVWTSRLDALALFPKTLSINPHYIDPIRISDFDRQKILNIVSENDLQKLMKISSLDKILNHQGETRETRLRELLEMDKRQVILGLREGAYIVVDGKTMELKGKTGGVLFRYGEENKELKQGDDLNYLV